MGQVAANGIQIEYETAGDPADPPLLLIMGLGAQLIAWDDDFVRELASRGLHVIRFDNRDQGLSTWFDDAGVPDVVSAAATGVIPEPAYTLADMADDAAGLLDALGIEQAHVCGVSMGGMIGQTLVLRSPAKVLSLVSIMSTTGDPAVGWQHPEALALLMAPAPSDRDAVIESAVKGAAVIGSTGYPRHDDTIRRLAAASYDRGFHPDGAARQLVAIASAPDRTEALRAVRCPTLVIHGEADPLIDCSGGRATAEAIPGADLWMIPGMGHDVPAELFAPIAERIAAHCLGG
jgi:pimeloyl-ACP methyl ester carboxylesterase